MEVVRPADECELYCGDARKVLPTLPAGTFDACICDPPYPMIKRPYEMLTEAEWFDLMRAVVPEVRRVLKPRGSAVFVLQPNSHKVGSVRGWLWEFMAWVCREWNMVQDAWWWNTSTMPGGGATRHGLMRGSLKACVWCGPPDCRRTQDAVLWGESQGNQTDRARLRFEGRREYVGGHGKSTTITRSAENRGGVTPFNVLPIGSDARWSGGTHGHGASTPLSLCDWWTRYLVPPGGAVLDPFAGSGTVGMAALRRGCTFVGIEKESAYVEIARKRLAEAQGPLFPVREDKA
jgi:hypothetical protein